MFDLKIVFSGLVMFVPNAYKESKAKMCALLVDGTNLKVKDKNGATTARRSLDGKGELRYHKAFVRFPTESVIGADPAKAESLGVWSLDRQRLILETEPKPAMNENNFEVAGDEIPPAMFSPVPENASSFSWAADINKIYEDYEIDATLLYANPPKGRVAAQFFIDQGSLCSESVTRFVMEFDSTLSDKIYKRAFSHEIALTLKNLESARLVAYSFDGSRAPRKLDLANLPRRQHAGENDSVEIYVLNLCTENPLQWRIDQEASPDLDSKWYYELLSEKGKEALKDELGNGFLPIPKPLKELDNSAGPGSPNCIPKRTSRAVNFYVADLDSPHVQAIKLVD